ncbi:NAD(P)-binding protein [Pluteus cervinus]|uniref:NAD(P)-binding protein n=1 Tax=Pluteus cervinus TaxID=181527 RepID=A0ACD3AKI1_9AGAR|nr:NAD(P)-binding protein [Pluteus cervinus]
MDDAPLSSVADIGTWYRSIQDFAYKLGHVPLVYDTQPSFSTMQPRVWLVTGASSGFGRLVTEIALAQGDIVVATLRTPSMLAGLVEATNLKHPTQPPRLLTLKCDVTKPEDVRFVFAQTVKTYGQCDVVFNNAGWAMFCEAENPVQDEAARGVFETNFWGAVQVSREAVKVFRDMNPMGTGGVLLNMSSTSGFAPWPGFGFYAASKFALEGFTEALALELDPAWNIRVTILEPGLFETPIITKSKGYPPLPEYTHKPDLPVNVLRHNFFSAPETLDMGDAHLAMERVVQCALLPDPPLRFVLGRDAIAAAKRKLELLGKEVEKYEKWSDNLYPGVKSQRGSSDSGLA